MTESKIAFKSEYKTNKSTVSSLAVLLIFLFSAVSNAN